MRFEEFKKVYKPEQIIKLAGKIENYDGNIRDFINKATSERNTGTLLRGIVKALMLFTGGNVASVRDPEKFDPEKSKQFDLSRVGRMLDNYASQSPTKDDYQISNYILKILAQSKAKKPWNATQELYRGLHSLSANAFLALCKPGTVYSLGEIISTSISAAVATNFVNDKPRYQLVYTLDNTKIKKGIYTAGRTSAYAHEEEVVLGGKIKITGFRMIPTYNGIFPFEYAGPYHDEIKDFDKLMEYVQLIENLVEDKKVRVGEVTVYAEVLP